MYAPQAVLILIAAEQKNDKVFVTTNLKVKEQIVFPSETSMSVVACPLINEGSLQAHLTPFGQSDRAGFAVLVFWMLAVVQL